MEERRELERKTKEELKQLAQGLEIEKISALKKDELIDATQKEGLTIETIEEERGWVAITAKN